MPNSPLNNVRPAARELVVVFVGVLFALAADSWWEGRQAERRLEANLQAVVRDMQNAADQLTAAITADSIEAEGLLKTYEMLLTGRPDSIPPGFDPNDFNIALPAVSLGTLRLVVNSSDVRLVTDDRARAELVTRLAGMERMLGYLDQYAAEVRGGSRAILGAKNEALATGLSWPDAALGNATTMAAVELSALRLQNLVHMLRATRTQAAAVESAAASAVGTL